MTAPTPPKKRGRYWRRDMKLLKRLGAMRTTLEQMADRIHAGADLANLFSGTAVLAQQSIEFFELLRQIDSCSYLPGLRAKSAKRCRITHQVRPVRKAG